MRRWRIADRRGNVAIIAALALVPLMLAAGLALDLTRLWLLQVRLQAAVDAAVLQAAGPRESSTNTAQATLDAGNLFWVNFGRTSRAAGTGGTCAGSTANTGFMGATVCDTALSVTFPDAMHVKVSATASLPTTFMRLANINAVPVSVSATALHATGVEVALVLDISLSMTFPMNDGTSNTKEQALQSAAQTMLSTLYGASDMVPNLWVSVVPFAGAVNVGNSHTNWLDGSFTSGTFKGSVDNGDGVGWRGCVEARQGNNAQGTGLDLSEDGPAAAPFAPFYWPSTYQKYPKSPISGGGYYRGDNDWTASSVTDTDSFDQTRNGTNIPQGPNLGCPHSAVLPLTASKTTVSNVIRGLTLTNPVGTVVVQGLQWGWFTLSPSWQGPGGWNLTTPQGAALPLSYTAPNNTKVIVLMTDGTTDVSGADTFYGAANRANGSPTSPACNQTVPDTSYATIAPGCNPYNLPGPNSPKSGLWAGTDADTWYSPYGRVSAGRVLTNLPGTFTGVPASDSGTAAQLFSQQLDSKFTALCTSIKSQNIIIYTIYFHSPYDDYFDPYLGAGPIGAKPDTLLQNCATDKSHFFSATSTATLSTAFVQIAKAIVDSRLTQ